jgi:uncharacterized membrane protein
MEVNYFKTDNEVIMKLARESLIGNWGLAIVGIVINILVFVFIEEVIPKASLIISGPMELGLIIFSLSLSRRQHPALKQLFRGFAKFKRAVVASFLIDLFIILHLLLLIVPGIIAALSYSMTFYIIADDPSIGALDAISKSKVMMYGYKWKLFCLGCRFIGWALLSILTLGIGLLWLLPYASVSAAKFYDDIKNDLIIPENA